MFRYFFAACLSFLSLHVVAQIPHENSHNISIVDFIELSSPDLLTTKRGHALFGRFVNDENVGDKAFLHVVHYGHSPLPILPNVEFLFPEEMVFHEAQFSPNNPTHDERAITYSLNTNLLNEQPPLPSEVWAFQRHYLIPLHLIAPQIKRLSGKTLRFYLYSGGRFSPMGHLLIK
jgi:hypothetical protein